MKGTRKKPEHEPKRLDGLIEKFSDPGSVLFDAAYRWHFCGARGCCV